MFLLRTIFVLCAAACQAILEESEGQIVTLAEGDSWVVLRGAAHRYRIVDAFVAVEATNPPSHVHGRDEPR